MKMVEVLALIPARGNSKYIPRKNILDFAGYPLIAYSITAALRSKHISRVIVSTDNEEIAAVSRKFGAETPFNRPEELARDDTMDFPVYEHALLWLQKNEKYEPEIIVQLRPTSPVIPKCLIDNAISALIDNPNADSVRGVVPAGENPYKMWHIRTNGTLRPVVQVDDIPEAYNVPRQRLPKTYWQAGHIDVIWRKTILEKHSMSGDTIFPIVIKPEFSVDIDTPLEWKRAERVVREGKIDMVYPGHKPREFPNQVKLLVLDFDGVMTDDRVLVDQNGKESIVASRSDGMGLELLRNLTKIEVAVISKETNPVVTARCKKLGLQVFQSINRKEKVLLDLINKKKINSEEVIYLGNDHNDIECFPIAGYAAVPNDAFITARRKADLVLDHCGGFGAVREICEMLIKKYANK